MDLGNLNAQCTDTVSRMLNSILSCVVVFFWSSGIMDCMLFTFGKRVTLMR